MTSCRSKIAWLTVAAALTAGSLGADESGTDHPRRGDFEDDYRDPATNAVMHYRMIVPEDLPRKRTLGLIVAFHGMNGNEDHMTRFALDSARRVGIADEYVVMGGKSKGDGWSESDDSVVLAWIEWVKSTYPIDPRRVHLIGMSNGGWMVKRFGWRHQNLFASVSPYCGGGTGFSGAPPAAKQASRRSKASPGKNRTEWYFVHGDADTQVGVESSRLAVKQLAQKGYRYVYREIDGADHGGILRYPDVAADNFRFIHASRSKEIQISKEERTELASSQKQLKSAPADTALPRISEVARLGGPAGALAIRSALRNSDPAVKKAAIEVAGSVFFDRDVALELVRLTRDRSDEIRAAAYKGLSTLANWRLAEAQAFLAHAARKRSLRTGDRVAAIEGLAHTAKLMLLGWYEDKDVLWTLVVLLDDQEESVREAAFAALRQAGDETFGYSPDLAPKERRAAATKWAAWCEEHAGKPR